MKQVTKKFITSGGCHAIIIDKVIRQLLNMDKYVVMSFDDKLLTIRAATEEEVQAFEVQRLI